MKYKLIIKEKITREYVRKIKDEDIPIIIGMSQNGLPTRIIATHFGVSEETLRRVLIRNNISRRR
jgi:DNA invertase Pin-like site-specific DNA recombinase